jgi:hypothetical protein
VSNKGLTQAGDKNENYETQPSDKIRKSIRESKISSKNLNFVQKKD